jgi:pilin isopeptide linkage protein
VATKTVEHRSKAVEAGEFKFQVMEGDTKVADGETLAGGTIKFDKISYTQDDIGEHEYVISEVVPQSTDSDYDEHIAYTATPVTVKVKVSDAGNGQLDTDVTYPDGGAKFVNGYKASGSVVLEATKELSVDRNKEIADGEFSFRVTENGEEVTTGTTQAGGAIKFNAITYSAADIGEHEYVISEIVPIEADKDVNIGYTAEPVTVTVTVSDANDGQLDANVTYPEGGAKFVNDYTATGSATLTATKTVTGREEKVGAGEFTFTVTEEGKTEPVATGATLEGGTIEFTAITYDQDEIGTHKYLITEDIPTEKDETIGYDAPAVEVTIKVSDKDGSGVLSTEITYPKDGAKFANQYLADGAFEPDVKKVLTGTARWQSRMVNLPSL